jgi:hypothetical protein
MAKSTSTPIPSPDNIIESVQTEQNKAIKSAIHAVDIASLGVHSIEQILRVLKAICLLSEEDAIIHGMAQIGVDLADNRHNQFDREREKARFNLVEAEGS